MPFGESATTYKRFHVPTVASCAASQLHLIILVFTSLPRRASKPAPQKMQAVRELMPEDSRRMPVYHCTQNYLADTEFQRLDRSGAALQPAGSPPAGQRGILPYSAALPMRRTGLQLVNVEIRYKASTAEDTGVIEENLVSPLEPKAPARETLSSGHGQPEQQLSPREHDPLHDLEANCGAAVSGLMHRQPAYFLKASIRDFSAHVRVGERIGIVGRTGAGR